jgi:hypothetical protein
MASITSSITEAVPQISYDVIGRLVPGTTVILSLAIVYVGPTRAFTQLNALLTNPNSAISVWALLLLLLIAYTVSIVLFGIWNLARTLLRRMRSPKKERDPKQPSPALMYDAIRVKSPEAGARLVKLSAERHLAQVLITGWSIAGALNLYLLIRASSMERVLLEIAFAVGIIGAYSFMRRIEKAYNTNLKNHWLILQCDQQSTHTVSSTDG